MSGKWRVDPRRAGRTTISSSKPMRQPGGAQRSPAIRLRGSRADRGAWTWARSRRSGPSRPSWMPRVASGASGAIGADQGCCCSTSGSSRGLAISMSARRFTERQSIRAGRRDGCRSRLRRLVEAIGEVIEEAIEAGGSTLRDSPARTGSSAISRSDSRSTAGRAGMSLRREGQANRAGRPIDILLPALPALTLSRLSCRGAAASARGLASAPLFH